MENGVKDKLTAKPPAASSNNNVSENTEPIKPIKEGSNESDHNNVFVDFFAGNYEKKVFFFPKIDYYGLNSFQAEIYSSIRSGSPHCWNTIYVCMYVCCMYVCMYVCSMYVCIFIKGPLLNCT